MDDSAIRLADIAKRYVGVGSTTPGDDYLNIICGSNDWTDKMRAYFLAHPSTCALFARGVLRHAGVKHDVLSSQYVIGQAVSDLVTIGSAFGAWRLASQYADKCPNGGDIWIIMDIMGGHEHVGICTSDPLSYYNMGYVVDTVEGGQAPDSSFIMGFTRRFLKSNGPSYMLGNRRLYGWIDHTKLPIQGNNLQQYAQNANRLAVVQHVMPNALDVDGGLG